MAFKADLQDLYSRRDQLIRLYESAQLKLEAQIRADIKAGTRAYSRAYRERRLSIIRSDLSALQDMAVPRAADLAIRAYKIGASHIADQTGVAMAEFGTGIHREAIGLLADNIVSGLNGGAEMVGRRVADMYRQIGLQAASQTLLEGSALQPAARALGAELVASPLVPTSVAADGTVIAMVDAGGRAWGLDRYSSMVIRTTTAESVTQGTVNQLLEAGLDLIEVIVADPCDICAPYEGNIYSLTGTTDGYDQLDEQPPFHPNCVCIIEASSVQPESGDTQTS
jgi:hypothetical protein